MYFTSKKRPSLSSILKAKRKGQALVEFVMVFMIFLVCILFAIELTNVYRAKSMLNLATFLSARSYAVSKDTSLAQQVAQTYLKGTAFGDVPTPTLSSYSPSYGDTFTLTLSIEYMPLVPLVGQFFAGSKKDGSSSNLNSDGSITLSSSVAMIAD